jgi:hypothetical protein
VRPLREQVRELAPAFKHAIAVPERPPAAAPMVDGGSRRWLIGLEWALLYLVVYGRSIILGAQVLVLRLGGGEYHRDGSTPAVITTAWHDLALTGAAVIGAVLLLRYRRRLDSPAMGLRVDAPLRAWSAVTVIFFFAVTISLGNVGLIDHLVGCTVCGGYPPLHTSPGAQAFDAVSAGLTAGFGEEILVCAMLVVTGEQLGWRTRTIYAVGILARLAYHDFYGPGVVGLALWAAVAIWLFTTYRLLWPTIAVHAAWDMSRGMNGVGGVSAVVANLVMMAMVWAAIGVIMYATLRRAHLNKKSLSSA